MKITVHKRVKHIIRYLVINTLIGLIFYFYLHYSEKGIFPKLNETLPVFIAVTIATNIIGLSIHKFNRLINRFFKWKRNISIRFLIGIVLNYTLSLALIFGLLAFYLLFFHEGFFIAGFFEEYNEITVRIYILSFFAVFVYVITDFAFYSYNQYSVVQIENVKQVTEQIELQFEALKTQLSPHYLFNSLNTISSLLYKDAGLTEQFIRKLAKTYQYILDSDSKKLVQLAEELKFIEAYQFLLDVRFGNKIQFHFAIEEEYRPCYLPPLSLQILIENAVKHNAFDEKNKLHINVYTAQNKLVIENNKLRKPQHTSSFKIGLDNIKKRYVYFTNKPMVITDNENFKVSLPLLQKKNANPFSSNTTNNRFNILESK